MNRWVPRFRLSWLFALITVIAIYVAASDSHRRAGVRILEITQILDTALEEVRTVIYEANVSEFERLNANMNLEPFRNGTPERPYASLGAFNEPDAAWSNVSPGILTFNAGFERKIRLGAYIPPSLSGQSDIVFRPASKVSANVICRIPWRLFAGNPRVTISGIEDAPMNDEFARRLAEKLVEKDVEFVLR